MSKKDVLDLLSKQGISYEFKDVTEEKKEEPKKQEKGKKTQNKKGETKLKLEAKKSKNFSEWYSEVIIKADLINYYNVSGCYILKPDSYFIWE